MVDQILVTKLLIGIGYEEDNIIVVNSAIEGNKILAVGKIKTVLLDLGLPDSRNLEALHALQKSNFDIAIIILSGTSSEKIIKRALESGAQDYLVKGKFNKDLLKESIRKANSRQVYVNTIKGLSLQS